MGRLDRLIFAGLLGLLGALGSLTPWLADLEQDVGLAWLFEWRGRRPPPPEAVVVAIDRESATELGLPERPRDWPRSIHARLIDKLAQSGASAIAVDLAFTSPSQDRRQDQALADALRAAGNVVAVGVLRESSPGAPGDDAETATTLSMETVIPPIPTIRRALAAYAPFPLPRSGRVDGFWVFKDSAGEIPTLPTVALQLHAHCGPAGRTATHDSLPSGDRSARCALPAAIDGPRSRFLDFYGPPRTIKTIEYHQALGADAAEFTGKAVFVGYSGASVGEQDVVRDDYRTVFSRADGLDVSGVEIAATAFLNMLEGRSVRPLATSASLALIFAWGMVVAAAGCRSRTATSALSTLVAAGGYGLAAEAAFAASGLWLPLVVPLAIQTPIALFGGVWLRHRHARREREALAHTFGHFVPKPVVERLARTAGPITAVNQTVYGVCLASDADQYTRLAESMEPERLARLFNDYLAALFAPVERHGGIVSDVVGDAMVAIWAGDDDDRTLRLGACRAALEIADAVAAFGQTGDRPPMSTRIGLHAGRMMLGTVGAGGHFEYRAVGDIVNTTTRLEGLGKRLGVRLLVSAEVLEGVDEFLARPLGVFLLHGKALPISVYELLAEKPQGSAEQLDLVARFSQALDAYRRQAWGEAAGHFSAYLETCPGDGPARMYLERCQRYADTSPVGTWDPAIRIEGK